MTCGSIGAILQLVNPQKWGSCLEKRCGRAYGCGRGVTVAGSTVVPAVVSTVVAVPSSPAGGSAGAVGAGVEPDGCPDVGAGAGAGAEVGAGVLDVPDPPDELVPSPGAGACCAGGGPESVRGSAWPPSSEPPDPLLEPLPCDPKRGDDGAEPSSSWLEPDDPLVRSPPPLRPASPPEP